MTLRDIAEGIGKGLMVIGVWAVLGVIGWSLWGSASQLAAPAAPAQAAAVNRVMGPQDMGNDVWCYSGSDGGVDCIDMRLRAQLAALLAERSVPPTPTRGTVVEHP